MKKHPVYTLFFVLALVLFTGLIHADAAGTQSGTGKVIAIDPQGQAIVIDVGTGKSVMTVGAVIKADTVLVIKGKTCAPFRSPEGYPGGRHGHAQVHKDRRSLREGNHQEVDF